MRYRESAPTPALAEHVKLFWSIESTAAGAEAVELVLPDGCPELVFNLADRFLRICGASAHIQPASLFSGQITRSITIRPSGKIDLFGVRFQPSGACVLPRFAMHDLNDEILSIQELLGSEGTELEEKLNASRSFSRRMRVFEKFFCGRLASAGAPAVSLQAVKLIERSDGAMPITALAKRLGASERSLERAFHREVGLSPKMLSRIVRFQRLIGLIRRERTPGNLDAFFEVGYYDQSHAIRDFREFSGTTPSNYFKTTHALSDVFVSGTEVLAGQ